MKTRSGARADALAKEGMSPSTSPPLSDNSTTHNNSNEQHKHDQQVHRQPPWKGVSFSCGGWLQFYLFGVGRAMQVRGVDKNLRWAGCSAGALAAAGCALGGDFDVAIQNCKEDCVPAAHSSLMGLFDLPRYIVDSAELGSFMHRYHKLKPGELQVATTGLPWLSKRRIMDFSSIDDVRTALLASCAIVPFAKLVHFRGCWNVDGGVTDFNPLVYGEDGQTPLPADEMVTVSPFYFSSCDIKPSRYVPFWWAIVPPNDPDCIDWVYALGYEDAMRFIDEKMGPAEETPAAVEAAPVVLKKATHSSSECPSARDPSAPPCYRHPLHRRHHHPSESYDRSAMAHLQAQKHSEHGNVRRKMSIRRFLGYKDFFPHYSIEMLFDAGLVLLVLFVWKPLILLLIYAEIFLKLAVFAIATIVTELSTLVSPVTMVAGGLLMLPRTLFITNLSVVLYLRKLLVVGPGNLATYDKIWKCVLCVGSMSLLIRFVSGLPTPKMLNKHAILEEISLVYRFFKYVV